jgi:hypothetical protein
MEANENGVTITNPTGNKLLIPRDIVEKGISLLVKQGSIDVNEVHHKITNEHRTMTDKLMAVLRMLPGVEIESKSPRKLSYTSKR